LHFAKGLIEVVVYQAVIVVRAVSRAFTGSIGTAWIATLINIGKDIQQGGARREG